MYINGGLNCKPLVLCINDSLNCMWYSVQKMSFYLYMHLDDGFAYKCGSKEGPERHQEVATRDARQIKQRVRNLKHNNTHKSKWQM